MLPMASENAECRTANAIAAGFRERTIAIDDSELSRHNIALGLNVQDKNSVGPNPTAIAIAECGRLATQGFEGHLIMHKPSQNKVIFITMPLFKFEFHA